MTKEQWRQWYSRVYSGLSEVDRIFLDQSEELREAIMNGDYFFAEQIVLNKLPQSSWTI